MPYQFWVGLTAPILLNEFGSAGVEGDPTGPVLIISGTGTFVPPAWMSVVVRYR